MSNIKPALQRLFYRSGGNAICRYLLRRNPRVIMMHNVVPDDPHENQITTVSKLRDILTEIKRNYTPLLFKDLLQDRSVPNNAVAITFDDGYQSFHDLVFPLLQEFEIPATVFVCPELIDSGSCIWPDKLIDLHKAGFRDPDGRCLQALIADLKRMNNEARNKYICAATDSLDSDIAGVISPAHNLMSWEMINSLTRSSLVEIGSHTQSHVILATESLAVAEYEIVKSKARLEEKLGIDIKTFCYPNGHPTDYTQEHTRMVSRAGYLGAAAAHFGVMNRNTNLFAIPRVGGEHNTRYDFYKYLDGVEFFQRKLTGDARKTELPVWLSKSA